MPTIGWDKTIFNVTAQIRHDNVGLFKMLIVTQIHDADIIVLSVTRILDNR